MNKTAQMFTDWGVVRDVRVLPNPDYMSKDESLPRFLQGTSVDEVSQRAVMSAIDDMEHQRKEEEETWAHPDTDLIATIVPEPVEGDGADAADEEGADEEDPEASERAENLQKIRWLGSARLAAQYAAMSQTEIDRAQLRQWEEMYPKVFPGDLVFPLSEYPDGMS